MVCKIALRETSYCEIGFMKSVLGKKKKMGGV